MATLGTQNISTSYPQLLKVSGNTPFTSTLLAIATGDESSVSALQISTLGVSSSGTLNSVGATTLASSLAVTGAVTLSSSLGVTGTATVGTLKVGASGPSLTAVSYGTFAFSGGTVQTHAANDSTTGTFALSCQLGDIVIGSINSLGSTTGTGALLVTSFFPIATDVVEYNIIGKGTTAGTIPAGTIFATALRFTA
jgi:hypothetical protein